MNSKEWLEGRGFPASAIDPKLERVPADIRETVKLYLDTLPGRLAAGDGIIFIGGVGAGKTTALALIAQAAPSSGGVMFTTMNNLFDELFRVGSRNDEGGVKRVEDMYAAKWSLLLLDDVGTEYGGAELAMTRFHQLMEYRYSNKLATCISTNLSAEILKKNMPRIYDRLAERCVCAATRATTQRKRVSATDWQKELDENIARGEYPWLEELAEKSRRETTIA